MEIKNLKDIVQLKNGKKRPKVEGNIPIYGGNGILGYTSKSNANNCVIVGRVGAYCGSVFYEKNECWISDNAIMVQAKNSVNIEYIYYLLKSLHLNERKIGTSQPLLTQEILGNIMVPVYTKVNQDRIVGLLSLIDNKININNLINKNLVA